MKVRNLHNILAVALVLTLLSASCARHDEPADRTVFRYNEAAGISSLDPAFARNQSNIWAVTQIFEGLVQLDDQLRIQPCIAHHWSISADGLIYTFHLRDDVFFHHDLEFSGERGRRVLARDVVYSFQRIADPSLASPGAWVFNEVARRPDGTLDISAPDDTTLVVRLQRPFPPFLGLLSMPYCTVVDEEAVKAYGPDFRIHPIGTGPFRFKFWKEGVRLVLRRNPWYHEADAEGPLPRLEAVSISFIIDKQAAFLEFVKGKLDFMSGIDASYKDELLTPSGTLNPRYADRIGMISEPYLNTEYLGFLLDSTNLPAGSKQIADKRVRQAINLGFDRQRMIRYLRNDIGIPGTSGFIPAGLAGFDSTGSIGYGYDPDRARKLLEEAGYPGGEGLPEVVLSTTAEYVDLCKFIQHELELLGIRLRIDVTPAAALKEMKAQAKLPFFRGSWIADYPDAENYLSLFLTHNFTPGGPNYCRYSNPEVDQLYAEAMREVSDTARAGLYHRMDSLIMADAPVVVLYYDEVLRFYRKGIEGLGSNPINLLKLKQVSKVKG